jgi:bacterioferritin-associated ferredoxin
MSDYDIAMERIAPCGLHCGKCFAFTKGDIHDAAGKLKENLGDFAPYAKRFSTALDPVFQNYPEFAELLDYIAGAQCGGCRKEKCKFYKNCKVRSCTEAKGVDFCFQCDEFPCNHTGLDENLYKRSVEINRRIQEIGIVAYYNEVKNKPRY